MKKNMNRAINEKYFNDPVQNAAFICCIDVLAELVVQIPAHLTMHSAMN